MATDQQFCLRWNNHQSTLISVFDSLLENGTLVDCTLAAEGQYLKAHKVVLSACSPYLETLLSQHYEKHPIVILKDVKFTELKSMMDYMYRGEVNISQDQLGTFLKAAESLQIKGLTDNGDDAAGGSTTTKRQDVPSRPSVTEVRNTESKRPAPPADFSDASREGSISPSSLRKRRRTRRTSQGDDPDSHLDTTSNVCDYPINPSQTTPLSVPSSNVVPTPVQNLPKQIVKQEPISRIENNLNSTIAPESGLLKEKIEPPSEPLLEPKTEYLDYMNNENSIEVEDLTLDDDEDLDSSMDASRPGPSHGDMSNQGYQWPMSGDQSGTDEIFMAAQQAVGAASAQQRDSQDWMGHQLLNYYGILNKGMYDHFIVNRQDGDYCSVKSEDSEDTITPDPSVANIKPRKTKFPPQSFHNCSFCGKWYRSKTSLGLHQRLECGKEPAFQCPYCPLKTHQKGNLQVHIKKKHSADGTERNQSLRNRNPILAQELGMMPSMNIKPFGINREINSELTITRTQPRSNLQSNYSRTPNLSHLLSQPNKAWGVTQFPLTVTEINSPSRHSNNQPKIRVKGLVNIPSGIEVTQRRISNEKMMADVTITPTIHDSSADEQEQMKCNEPPITPLNNTCDRSNKPLDVKKLPELTRILNSQEPIPPVPVIVDSFSIPNSSIASVENVPCTSAKEADIEKPDSTD